jgi:hypothetical protein
MLAGALLTACARGPAVILRTTDGAAVRVHVEVVNTPAGRTQGLMYRSELAADAGMLFVFPRDGVLHFWMKNTLIPLDMLFIDRDRRVVGIVANARPLSEQPVGPDTPARYVLEVNGGFAAAHRVSKGATVEFVDVPDGAS